MAVSGEQRADDRSEVNEAFKTLVLLHAGATVALLGFLQNNWNQQPALSKAMIGGMWFFVAGLVLAVFIPITRHYRSMLRKWEYKARDANELTAADRYRAQRTLFRRVYILLFALSMLCFAAGAARILWQAGQLLP